MKTLPRFRFARFAHSALPVALFCAMAPLPAVAVTIDTTPTARPAVTTQLAKAEKKARKLCKKGINKQGRKLGPTFTCTPTGIEPAPGATVASNAPRPAGAGGSGDPVQDALTGPDSIPAGFVNKLEGDEGGEPAESLANLAAVPGTVPEPGSLALLGTGLLGLSLAARRRKHKAA